MHWHAEITMRFEQQIGPGEWIRIEQLTLRGYHDPSGHAQHAPFDAVAQALIEGGRAFVSGALVSHQPIRRREWMQLCLLLRDDYGALEIVADRKRALRRWEVSGSRVKA